jgi:hypothetical protein
MTAVFFTQIFAFGGTVPWTGLVAIGVCVRPTLSAIAIRTLGVTTLRKKGQRSKEEAKAKACQ